MDAKPEDGHRTGEPERAEPLQEEREGPEPFSAAELRRALLRPDLAMECVLGGADRLRRNLAEARGLWWLAALLLATSLLSTVPYGAVAPKARFWTIAALYTGSLFICFPSLHVFAQFLGFRFRLEQNLALSLVLTSVAGLFTFGFFPIIWFIDATTQASPDSAIQPGQLSVCLLTLSLVMGMGQMGRCLASRYGLSREAKPLPLLMSFWLVLLTFITYRMATVLELL